MQITADETPSHWKLLFKNEESNSRVLEHWHPRVLTAAGLILAWCRVLDTSVARRFGRQWEGDVHHPQENSGPRICVVSSTSLPKHQTVEELPFKLFNIRKISSQLFTYFSVV